MITLQIRKFLRKFLQKHSKFCHWGFTNRIVVLDTNQDQNYKNTICKTEVSQSEFISSLCASKSSPDKLLGNNAPSDLGETSERLVEHTKFLPELQKF